MSNIKLKITIPGTFPGLNDFINADRVRRGSWSKGNQVKRENQEIIANHILNFIRREKRRAGFHSRLKPPVVLHYTFYEPNRRRDLDNISGFFHKVFQDALVEVGLLKNDNWVNIIGFSDRFECDPANPRIEIEIEEIT